MSNFEIRRDFQEFGKDIYSVAMLSVLSFAFPFLLIIALIFMFKALRSVRNASIKLNDQYLAEFRSRYTSTFILRCFSLTFIAVSVFAFIITLIFPVFFNPWYILMIAILGLVILLGGSVLKMSAWENLKVFFIENKELFPEMIWSDAVEGCEKLKKGAKMYVLAFLIIPIVIGILYQISGIFKLAKLNKL